MPNSDWNAYYQKEPEIRRFLPEQDRDEMHRVEFALSLFPKGTPSSVLDIGCGDGYFCSVLAKRGIGDVHGVDLSTARIERASSLFPLCHFTTGDIQKLEFEIGRFDMVTAIQVLEHLEDPLSTLREMKRVSRHYVLFTVPYRQQPRPVLCPKCGETSPLDGHIFRFDEQVIAQLCEEANLRIIRTGYFVNPSFLNENPLFCRLPSAAKRMFRHFLFKTKLVGPLLMGILCAKRP